MEGEITHQKLFKSGPYLSFHSLSLSQLLPPIYSPPLLFVHIHLTYTLSCNTPSPPPPTHMKIKKR